MTSTPPYLKTAALIVFSAMLILGLIFFLMGGKNSSLRTLIYGNPQITSKSYMVESLWYNYKSEYLEEGSFRTVDRQRANVTTSEGQSYTLLRSVWMNDSETFDKTLKWTKDNLSRKDDRLFSWLFGQRKDGTYGILTDQGGMNTASDADVDIALALLFASERWNNDDYFGDAIVIIRDIWDKEVLVINGKPYLLANNVEKTDLKKKDVILNPSYFAPYAFKIFSLVDSEHDWNGLVDSSYEVLNANLDLTLDTTKSAKIPSDWLAIDKRTGKLSAVTQSASLTTNFGYDALRTPWRISLDAAWFGDVRAKDFLSRLSFFTNEWEKNSSIAAVYKHDGTIVEKNATPAMYGGIIGYFDFADGKNSDEVYLTKLESLYNPDTFNWKTQLSYYDSNWAWFGIALHNGILLNLYSVKPIPPRP